MKDNLPFYVSHLIKPKGNLVMSIFGEVCNFYIQIISSKTTERKTVCFIENEEKRLFNVNNQKELNILIASLISKYEKFQPDILSFDTSYDADFTSFIIQNFAQGCDNLREKVNQYKIENE